MSSVIKNHVAIGIGSLKDSMKIYLLPQKSALDLLSIDLDLLPGSIASTHSYHFN
jgi:hypothetical protein